MNCSKCGRPNPPGAGFCMHCGQPLVVVPAPQAAAPGPMPPYGASAVPLGAFDAQRKRNAMIATAAGLAALAAAGLLGARALGLIHLGGSLPGDALRLNAATGPPVLQKPASEGPPVLQAAAVGMPKDVEDWLKHLQETERRKRILTQRQTTELMGLKSVMELGVSSAAQVQQLSDPDQIMDKMPDQQALRNTIDDEKPAWYRLNDYFLSVPAPVECQTIQQNYSVGLCQIGDTMEDIAKIVDSINPASANLNNDVKAGTKDAYQIQQTHRETVDDSFKKALFGVDEVCKKYNRNRWFDIDVSGGGSGILGDFVGGSGG